MCCAEEELQELFQERYDLVSSRIREIVAENVVSKPYDDYFQRNAEFFVQALRVFELKRQGILGCLGLDELRELNGNLYGELVGNGYDTSYANPAYCCRRLGERLREDVAAGAVGRILSAFAAEFHSVTVYAYEGDQEKVLVLSELFVQLYTSFEDGVPGYREVQQILYWYVWDYMPMYLGAWLDQLLLPEKNPFRELIGDVGEIFGAVGSAGKSFGADRGSVATEGESFGADRESVATEGESFIRALYLTGEYISPETVEMAEFVNGLPEEAVRKIASTYTEGFRQGFVQGRKDLSIKKLVEIRTPLGFERILGAAVEDFACMGLEVTMRRDAQGIHTRNHAMQVGCYGLGLNPQFAYDHVQDLSLIMDKKYVSRRLEVLRGLYEVRRKEAGLMAGPAVIEFWGEAPGTPCDKPENAVFNEKQREWKLQLESEAAVMMHEYIPPEERSFTIISFPTPGIGEDFPEIFRRVVEINTLDCELYRRVQQHLIDALDQGVKVHVLGAGENETDLTVALASLRNPERETIFENCVADVNIPVGEVFTSPKLRGTQGVLHVTGVYLNGIYYKNLRLEFRDGMICDYSCGNRGDGGFEDGSLEVCGRGDCGQKDVDFSCGNQGDRGRGDCNQKCSDQKDVENGKRFLENTLLQHHPTLPMGEFAIGTNTLAYTLGRKFGIQDRLPILIAEKTGPHFAVGDTCYSYEEDRPVYNPDGKEVIARENECSILRNESPDKAYFQCHTDITIPYDELGSIRVIRGDGSEISLIENGRFVLPGTEVLNEGL